MTCLITGAIVYDETRRCWAVCDVHRIADAAIFRCNRDCADIAWKYDIRNPVSKQATIAADSEIFERDGVVVAEWSKVQFNDAATAHMEKT